MPELDDSKVEKDPIRPQSVLLAEDTPANRQIIRSVLTKHGHMVTFAANGREALEQLVKEKFDVVLMDLEMPVMDGYQATSAIRELERNGDSHTPIVALTAHSTPEDRDQCLALGMDAYLAKPIDMPELLRVVGQLGGDQGTKNDECEEVFEEIDLPATLKRLGGDKQLLRELIELFEEDAPLLLDTVQKAIEQQDPVATYRAAHSLRGLAANFGAAPVMQAASEVEKAGKQNAFEQAQSAYQTLSSQIEKLIECLAPLRRA